MKNASVAAIVAGLTCALLISGCGGANRRAHQEPTGGPAATSAPAAVATNGGTGSGAAGAAEPLSSVDDLIRQLDEQVGADDRAARDSD